MKAYFPFATLFLVGCAATPTHNPAEVIRPTQAIELAAAAPDIGIHGTFALTVKTVAQADGGHLFLDSEEDYRDQRNLAVDVTPAAMNQLESKLGMPLDRVFKGHDILVTGTAKRAKIVFVANGAPTSKYYYQTHVVVTSASQIQLR